MEGFGDGFVVALGARWFAAVRAGGFAVVGARVVNAGVVEAAVM